MKQKQKIKYHLVIYCDVNKYGAVIPVASSVDIKDANDFFLGQEDYPHWRDIFDIWIGEYLQYLLKKK